MISIIIPVYNVKDCLPVCLDSVSGQTYTDVEVILVDDGSTDGSGAICDRYAQADARIKVIHKPNGGVSAARNTGLSAVAGEYVCFIDADDCVHPQYLEYLKKAIEAAGADLAICDYVKVTEYPENFTLYDEPGELRPVSFSDYSDYSVCMHNNVWAKLYKAELLRNHSFDESICYCEDAIFNYSLIYSREDCIMTKVCRPLYCYYDRPDGAVNTLSRDIALGEVDWYLAHWDVFLPQHEWIVCEHAVKTILQIRMETYLTPAYKNVMERWPGLSGRLAGKMKTVDGMPFAHKLKYRLFLRFFALYRLLLILNDPSLKEFEKQKRISALAD